MRGGSRWLAVTGYWTAVCFGLGVILLAGGGCASAPRGEQAAARAVRERFAARLAGQFQATNSVVFRLRGRELSGLGLVKVDRRDESFALACLNPVGVTLFALKGAGDKVECVSALDVFTRQGDFAGAVGADVRRVYFEVVPPADAEVRAGKAGVVFRQRTPEGCLEYVFDNSGVLVEKRFHAGLRRKWRVRYGYGEHDGKLVPIAIGLENFACGYRLTVRPLTASGGAAGEP